MFAMTAPLWQVVVRTFDRLRGVLVILRSPASESSDR